MNNQPEVTPKKSKTWLWMLLGLILLVVLGFVVVTYLVPDESDGNKDAGIQGETVILENVKFYPVKPGGPYSDQEANMGAFMSTCMIEEFGGKKIRVTYKEQTGDVMITKGTSPGCPPSVLVDEGTFTPTVGATETLTNTSTPENNPSEVVANFMNYTLETLPNAVLNYDKARLLLSTSIQDQYVDDATFASKFYGIQDGPTLATITKENISDETASVNVNAMWGEMGLGWAFTLEKSGDSWVISGFRNDAQ